MNSYPENKFSQSRPPLLKVEAVDKYYGSPQSMTKALDQLSFHVQAGEYIAVMGASGSGKTTLLNCISTIDTVSSGHILLEGRDITAIPPADIAAFRRESLGFVFQEFNLLDTFSLRDNIFLPLVLAGKKYPEMKRRLGPLAEELGIEKLLDKYPYEVSGGQKQRAAVARALITQPQLILADEPTGALDSRAADGLMDLFTRINAAGQTVLMVTHSTAAASRAGRVLFIRDGRVYDQLYREGRTDGQMYRLITETLTELTRGGEKLA